MLINWKKIGPSKVDGRTSKESGSREEESPPPTPKSVRPPLSPKIDQQLRLACAYVLQDFKPSQQIYEEQFGKSKTGKQEQRTFKPYHEIRAEAYGAVKDEQPQQSTQVVEPVSATDTSLASPPIISKQGDRAPLKQWSIASDELRQATLAVPKRKPTIKSQAFFEALHPDWNTLNADLKSPKPRLPEPVEDEPINVDLSNFNPPIMSQAFFEGVDFDKVRQATARAIQEPVPPISPEFAQNMVVSPLHQSLTSDIAPSYAEQIPPSSPKNAHDSVVSPLRRSLSNPILHSRNTSNDRSQFPPRAESLQTNVSSVRSQGTEHSRKPSTAPTSAVMTPARVSGRTSSQAAGFGSEKFLTADIEWMREELEKHKRVQEEARAQQELENQVLFSLGLEAMPVQPKQASLPQTDAPPRKPLLRSNTEPQPIGHVEPSERARKRQGSIQERRNVPPVPQLDSRQSRELEDSENRRHRSTPRSESRQELDILRSESRQGQRSRRPSEDVEPTRRRSISRDIKDYFKKPATERHRSPSRDVSRASSRSRRLFQVVLATDGTKEPPASLESTKPHSRTRSVESFQSAVSSLAPALRNVAMDRTLDHSEISDIERSTSQQSKRHSRNFSLEFSQSPDHHRKSKPSVNLNRELPPLPSLDQWKPEEPEAPLKPKHIVSMISPRSANFRLSEAASASEPNLVDRIHNVSPRIGSATASTSRIQSIYSRYSKLPEDFNPDDAPPYTPLPTDADFPRSATHERFDFREENDATPLPAPPTLNVEPQNPRVPSEYMFHANFGKVTSPLVPPPIPQDVIQSEADATRTIRRQTEDMFLPLLDARARAGSTDHGAPAAAEPAKPTHVANYSRNAPRQPNVLRKQNSQRAAEISAPTTVQPAVSHTKTTSEQINFSRKPSADNYSRLYEMGYRNIQPIQRSQTVNVQPTTAPGRTLSKRWWQRGTSKREKNRLGDVSNAGSQPSLVMMDENVVAHF